MSDQHKEYDVIVVGAGVVGPAVAVGFARQGRTVLLVERDLREPDRIVGELLQPGGCKALEKLGLEKVLEGIDAVSVSGYEVIYHGEGVNIPYPVLDAEQPNGPQETGRSFHHGRFVMNLRKAAEATPGVTMLQATVTQLVRNPYTHQAVGVICTDRETQSERHYHAKLTVMTDGIQSKFRKELSTKTPKVMSHFAGLVLQDAVLPAPNHGHVIIGDHQPILIYQIGTHETRVLCDVAGHLPSNGNGDLKRHLERDVLPHLPECVKPSFRMALEVDKIRTMPAQFLPADKCHDNGCVLIGDALNMRHPLTGGGMTVGLKDAVLLTNLLAPEKVADLANTRAVRRQMDEFLWQRKNEDSVINVLSVALYQLFAGSGDNLKVLQRGCFRYFQRGGACVSEPVSLLAGLLPQPMVLFNHFFTVAFFAIFWNLFDHGMLGFPYAFIQMFTVIWTACVVFVPFMWTEIKWY